MSTFQLDISGVYNEYQLFIAQAQNVTPINASTHPLYNFCIDDWRKWRIIQNGGDSFIFTYLKKFSRRESNYDFERRREITPNPAFAKSAILKIKNAIFQRCVDISRKGGSGIYEQVCNGQLGGVDLRGSTMNWFLGNYVIPELLFMKKVGVFVDSPKLGESLAEKGSKHPYLYMYRAEDIRNWNERYNDQGEREFTSVLLRDYIYNIDSNTGLPESESERFRHLWINESGTVSCQYYSDDNTPDGPVINLAITKIPFVTFELSDSLLKDIANHQIALLNVESSDVAFVLFGNVPFYVEQRDTRNTQQFMKSAKEAYNKTTQGLSITDSPSHLHADPTFQEPQNDDIDETDVRTGTTRGRSYGRNLDAPSFINPSSEPITASMAKQLNLKEDINKLLQNAVSNIQGRTVSAESKQMDNQDMESGLSYIGLELEHGDQEIAYLFSLYEGTPDNYATVTYPKKWSLQTESDRRAEVKELGDIGNAIPSRTFKKAVNKRRVEILMGDKISPATLETINTELDAAPGFSSDPDTLTLDITNGLISTESSSTLRGYDAGTEIPKAKIEQAERLALIQKAQSVPNQAARGIKDAAVNPGADAPIEKIGSQVRGQNKG